ncbi:MAG: CotH kinase family protein [Clostridia bacterium]|nr:CotH kinase family protein [Clostridia bacterium]
MRRNVIKTFLLVMLLVGLLAPLTRLLSMGQRAADANDAEHMVTPMLTMLAQGPQTQANTAVEPMMELEDAWAIEDTREESWENPLVIGMKNGESEMGFDRASNTFYCTLGMDGGDDWPELALFAQGAQGTENLRVAWIDDYSYDYRSDAIREGYRYELLAYTDKQYAYFGVVFTGLPIVVLRVHGGAEALSDDYVPARMCVSSAEHEAIHSGVWMHLRGGGFEKPIEKQSFRVEFHGMSDKGRDEKNARSVLGMPADTDWLLLGNAQDPTAVRNHMAWELWNAWNEGRDDVPMLLESRMAEVFVQDEYVGLYQVMQRCDEQEELARIGGDPQRDSVVRVVSGVNKSEKMIWDLMRDVNYSLEYRYEPHGDQEKALSRAEDYVTLSRWKDGDLDDEAFARMVEKRIDVENLMNYYAFFHGVALRDHVFNNLYLYTLKRGGETVYLHALWDMDTAFPVPQIEMGEWQGLDLNMTLTRRMMDLNLMDCREVFWSIWNEKRKNVFSDEAVSELLRGTQDWINASGAYLRESERWYGEAMELNLEDALYYQLHNMSRAEQAMQEMWPADR